MTQSGESQYQVLRFDNRGVGQTEAPDSPYSFRGRQAPQKPDVQSTLGFKPSQKTSDLLTTGSSERKKYQVVVKRNGLALFTRPKL